MCPIVELYKHAAIFKNLREVHSEAQGVTECLLLFLSVLKNSQDSYISIKYMHDVMKSNWPIIAHATPWTLYNKSYYI